jgi:hypothetical protein
MALTVALRALKAAKVKTFKNSKSTLKMTKLCIAISVKPQ